MVTTACKKNKVDPQGWDARECEPLIEQLWGLRRSMLVHAQRLEPLLVSIEPAHRASAINLAHYLALRAVDLRPLQEQLARLGLSSLGRAETHVLANLDKVLGILHRLAGRPWAPLAQDEPSGSRVGPALLSRNATALLGPSPPERGVRIMVTLPGDAACDEGLIQAMVDAGMDIARINCAHDTADQWVDMAALVRGVAARAGRSVKILMDLGGPKLRTGPIADGQAVVKLRPLRDSLGRTVAPARLGLRPHLAAAAPSDVDAVLTVDPQWFGRLAMGDRIELVDARSASRRMKVVECHGENVVLSCKRTTYLTERTQLLHQGPGNKQTQTALQDLPSCQGVLRLRRGDLVHLMAQGVGRDAVLDPAGARTKPAQIACTLPEALAQVRKGERIWFDDGRIGGTVRRRLAGRIEVEIEHAREGGESLAADKGINLPDTALDLPALTGKDLQDLETVARHADMVGLSFCQSAADVKALRARLLALGAGHVGLVLKIETRRGFDQLPALLLAAMSGPLTGVMIARGDLAVECGYERMAEVQEEILWACEAAHVPVVWATQVLETLAKTGLPTRAEITDAAMGERAECVMLNKGPHILDAIRMLDDILRRMQAHQSKKRPLMRALKSWQRALDGARARTAQ